jgi:hypothetical protein
LLLLGNFGDRCLPPSVQKQDGRRHKPQRSPAGDNPIATERRWPSAPELSRPQSRPRLSNGLPISCAVAAESASRFYTMSLRRTRQSAKGS